MKKIFTTLLAGTLLIPLGREVEANTANTSLQNGDFSCSSNSWEANMVDVILNDGLLSHAAELVQCYDLQNEAININASDIDTNTDNITTNTSNISTNADDIQTNAASIQTLQGSSSSADITANTNTSNINTLGEGVAGSTALTAALSALPQISKESKTTCGVGTGAYSSRYAVGFGCASKVSKRIDVNAGGSYVFGGSKSYGGGTLDSGVVKAGFVFKLGELNKLTQISFNDKKIIDKKISNLEENNKNLNAELELSKSKNDEIISQNQKLLARLEKLENIALKFQSSSEMISVAKKD